MKGMAQLRRNCPKLKNITLMNSAITDAALITLVEKFEILETILLSTSRIDKENSSFRRDLQIYDERINKKQVALYLTGTAGVTFLRLPEIIYACPSLHSIVIKACPDIRDDEVMELGCLYKDTLHIHRDTKS